MFLEALNNILYETVRALSLPVLGKHGIFVEQGVQMLGQRNYRQLVKIE